MHMQGQESLQAEKFLCQQSQQGHVIHVHCATIALRNITVAVLHVSYATMHCITTALQRL